MLVQKYSAFIGFIFQIIYNFCQSAPIIIDIFFIILFTVLKHTSGFLNTLSVSLVYLI